MAARRRGEIPGEQSGGLFRVSKQGVVSVGAVHLVIAKVFPATSLNLAAPPPVIPVNTG
jgi:hypothetical protein